MGECCASRGWAALTRVAWGVGVSVLLLEGCQFTQYTQTQETPEFIISVTVDPFPSPPGTELDVYATLRHDRQGVSNCRVRFSSRAAGADTSAQDGTQWVEAPEQGRAGVYRARAVLFKASGNWELHTGVRCLGRERIVVFNYVPSR